MHIKAVVWDLDGTLLNTLDDLMNSVNAALAMNGLPQHDKEAICRFVGNGVRKLIVRAVPQGDENPLFPKVYDDFIAHYGEHSRDTTKPYDGIMELLDTLRAQGVRHAIVSNKIDFAVKDLARAYFPGRIEVALGDDPSRARKPDPQAVHEVMRMLGVKAEETAYVGDSDVDVMTAHNAGAICCAVSWGFRSEESLREAGAEHIAATPQELYRILEAL